MTQYNTVNANLSNSPLNLKFQLKFKSAMKVDQNNFKSFIKYCW